MGNKQMKGKFSHSKNVILLDTGLTLKITIMNPNIVTDIIKIINPVVMTTKEVKKQLTLDALEKGLGPSW